MISKHYGIRTKTHKLIHYYQFGEWELFDYSHQLVESINLIDSSAEVSSLKERLALLKENLDDQGDKSIMPEKWRRIYRGPSARVE